MRPGLYRRLPSLYASLSRPAKYSSQHLHLIKPRYLSTTPSIPPPSPTPVPTDNLISDRPEPTTVLPDPSPVSVASTATSVPDPQHVADTISAATASATDVASASTEVAEVTAEVVSTTADAVATATSSGFSETLLQPAMMLLNYVHDVSGLPWWLSIAASTVLIRTAILPVTVMTMKNSGLMAALKDDIAERRESVMHAVRSGDRQGASVKQKEMQDFMRGAGVAPARVLLGPLVQFPVFISLFVSLRKMAEREESFMTGGTAWFMDLASRDPYYILPVFCGASLLFMTEFGGETGRATMTKEMKTGMRAIALLSVPLTYWFPAAVFCYWIPNNTYSVILGAAMRQEGLKKALGLGVDLTKIKGTKKWRQANAIAEKLRMEQVRSVDEVSAAASYVKVTDGATSVSKVGKPVILKQRPRKKKLKTSN